MKEYIFAWLFYQLWVNVVHIGDVHENNYYGY